MENIPDNKEDNPILSDSDTFTKIWTSPREVFKYLHENHYDKYVPLLLILAGISRSFARAITKNSGDQMTLWMIIGTSVIIGGLLGWLSFYIYAALVRWTGKWIDGQTDTISILRVFAYGMIPSIIALIILIPQMAFYGIEMFKAEGNIGGTGFISNVILYGSIAFQVILGLWTILLTVVGISVVQKFSIVKSILNLLLPILVFALPIMLIGFLFFNAFR